MAQRQKPLRRAPSPNRFTMTHRHGGLRTPKHFRDASDAMGTEKENQSGEEGTVTVKVAFTLCTRTPCADGLRTHRTDCDVTFVKYSDRGGKGRRVATVVHCFHRIVVVLRVQSHVKIYNVSTSRHDGHSADSAPLRLNRRKDVGESVCWQHLSTSERVRVHVCVHV